MNSASLLVHENLKKALCYFSVQIYSSKEKDNIQNITKDGSFKNMDTNHLRSGRDHRILEVCIMILYVTSF